MVPPASLADLDGTNGFRLDGIDAGDDSGRSVAGAGDVNGDGFADLIIGAPEPRPTGLSAPARAMLSLARPGLRDSLDLASLDGTNGFRLNGIDAAVR